MDCQDVSIETQADVACKRSKSDIWIPNPIVDACFRNLLNARPSAEDDARPSFTRELCIGFVPICLSSC